MKSGYISIYSLRVGLYKIREAAAHTGLTQRAIRYYEALGLLAGTKRSRGKIRLYTEADCQRLSLIKKLREQGKSLAEISGLLPQKTTLRTAIFVDSAFSLSLAQAAQYGVQIIPDTIRFGKIHYKDYTTLAPEQFAVVEKRKRCAAESEPPTVADYVALFSQAIAQGHQELVSLHPDQRLSRSYERACAAAAALPQFSIHVIDTQLMSLGFHYLLEKIQAQMSALEIAQLVKKYKGQITEFIVLGSLTRLLSDKDQLAKMLLDYVPILQHTAQSGLVPLARVSSLAAAGQYLQEHTKGFKHYRAGYSSPEIYKKFKAQLKNVPISSAEHYSSVLLANFSSVLVGLAAF